MITNTKEFKKKEADFIMGLTPVYVGTYVTAESASNIIDAEGIISGANSVKSQLSELDYLSSAVTSAGSRITANDLSVDGVGPEEKVGQVTSLINETKSNFESGLDGIITNAENYYNQIQEQYNEEARRRDAMAIEQAKNNNNNNNN